MSKMCPKGEIKLKQTCFKLTRMRGNKSYLNLAN